MVDTLRRPYAVAVAGMTTYQNFDEISLIYELRFNTTGVTNNESTELYIPEEMYQQSSSGEFKVEHDSRLGMVHREDEPNKYIFGTKTHYEAGSEMIIKVKPWPPLAQEK